MAQPNAVPALVVLAAGCSSRNKLGNKLLLPFANSSVLGTALACYLAQSWSGVWLVLGHQRHELEQHVAQLELNRVYNADYRQGMASSLVCGVRAAGYQEQGYAIALGDMPLIQPDTLSRLQQALHRLGPEAIVVPVADGRRGHPVLFGVDHRAGLLALRSDRGARPLMLQYPERVVEVAVQDQGIFADVDTQQCYRRMCSGAFNPS